MRYAIAAILLLFSVAAFGQLDQFRMVGSGSWSVVDDSTYSATVTFASDLTANSFLPTGVVDSMRVFTQRGQLYTIDSVGAKTFSTAVIYAVEYGGDWGSPSGQVLVYETRGRETVPAIPFATNGATSKLQEAVVTHNAAINNGVSTTQLADSTTAAKTYTNNQIASVAPVKDTIVQASHGFSVGDPIWYSGDYLLSLDTGLTVRVDGIISEVPDINTFVLQRTGRFTLTSHGFSVGVQLYVQPGGSYSATDTSNSLVYGYSIDANTIEIGTKPDAIRTIANKYNDSLAGRSVATKQEFLDSLAGFQSFADITSILSADPAVGYVLEDRSNRARYKVHADSIAGLTVDNNYQILSNDKYLIRSDQFEFNFIDELIDSTATKLILNATRDVAFNVSLTDTITFDRVLQLPDATNNQLKVSLKNESNKNLILRGNVLVRGNYVSGYKAEDNESISIISKDGNWEVYTNVKYPNYYDESSLYDFSEKRIGQYQVIGSSLTHDPVYESVFDEYDLLFFPINTKYEGLENRILMSNRFGTSLSGFGWTLESVGTPGVSWERVNDVNPFGEEGTNLVTTLNGTGGIFAHLAEPVDSAQKVNVSFWMKMVSDTAITVTVRGIAVANPYGAGNVQSMTAATPIVVSSKEWTRYTATIQGNVDAAFGRREILFRFADGVGGGTRFLFDNTTVRFGDQPSFDVITGRDYRYASDTMMVAFSPQGAGLVKTSSLVQTGRNTRKLWQQVLDYCQETENCSGLFIDGQYEIDSTLVLHSLQTIKGTHSAGEETANDPTKLANAHRIDFNPIEPGLTFMRADSVGRRGGETKPKTVNIENIYIEVQDTCDVVIELESSNKVLIDDISIHGQGMAKKGIAFSRVGHAADFGRSSLFCNLNNVFVTQCDTALALTRANYVNVEHARLVNNNVGIHVLNSGQVTLNDIWFESQVKEDVAVEFCDLFTLQDSYFERTDGISDASYNVTIDSSLVSNFYNNIFRASLGISAQFYLGEQVRRANLLGNVSERKLFEKAGTSTYVTELGNIVGEDGFEDYRQRKSTLERSKFKSSVLESSILDGNNVVSNDLFLNEVNLKGSRQNLAIQSDTIITFEQFGTVFSKPRDTIVGPFGRELVGVVYQRDSVPPTQTTSLGYNSNPNLISADSTYIVSFWGKIITKTDSTTVTTVSFSDFTTTQTKQFELTNEWVKYQAEITFPTTSANIIFRVVNPGSQIGDKIAIANLQIYESRLVNMGYIQTTTSIVDEDVVRINLGNTLKFSGNIEVTGNLAVEKYRTFTPIVYDNVDTLLVDRLELGFESLKITDELDGLEVKQVTFTTDRNVTADTQVRLEYFDISASSYTSFGSGTILNGTNQITVTGLTQAVTATDIIYMEVVTTGGEANGISATLKLQ